MDKLLDKRLGMAGIAGIGVQTVACRANRTETSANTLPEIERFVADSIGSVATLPAASSAIMAAHGSSITVVCEDHWENALLVTELIAVPNGRMKMSEELSGLPPQVQERLLRLQQLQQTLQSILAQKQQVEMEQTEIEQALSELQKLGEDAVVYKSTGSLMIKSEKTRITTELNERKELLTTRAQVITKQEERIRSQLKDVQTRLQQDLSPVSPAPG